MKDPLVTMEIGNGCVKIELYPDIAPNTVRNFISLARRGFYDGTLFHRVIPNFMIQGGDPRGNGTGGPGYCIRGEFSANRFKNELRHTRGVISMARSVNPNSAGSQFFIMVDDAPYLDGEYAAFGKVVAGMEEVDRIVATPRDYDDRPLKEQRIQTVTVETFGETYGEPQKIGPPSQRSRRS
jgi:peptidyl-prolyl cis-trans isomerase B (cyclophilin B)